ncbi:uncharacterized protein BDV14DRAFT_199668 [Aspergillus stella-maris]|uniref:uncharacterized protein n=1 Tax=Aspergillus stella-maris TaxID=1810926 RepID=UPI003CCD5B31
MANLSKRMSNLAKPRQDPKIGDKEPGWYHAPNGERYYGLGEVFEKGYTHAGSIYVRVKPILRKSSRKYQFFNLLTDEDMPNDCKPRYLFQNADTQRKYRGVGKVVRPNAAGPIPEMHEPPYQFFCIYSQMNIPDSDMPRAAYPGNAETQNNPNTRLGEEQIGAYIAPDGQWYAGAGRTVAVGTNDAMRRYIFVEPIPGKHGGDYDFFHPVTNELMRKFWALRRPGRRRTPCRFVAGRRRLPFSRRWRAFPHIECMPKVGEEYPGRYLPPNAPKRDVYIGVGRVVKTGLTGRGGFFVEVVPKPGKHEGNYQFFDPFTGKDMPAEYLPQP